MLTKGPYRGLLATIGRTPLVELGNISPNPQVRIYAKLEGAEPHRQRQGPHCPQND